MKAMLLRTPKGLRGATPADQEAAVRVALAYDPTTGLITWKGDRFCWNGRRKHCASGAEAGTLRRDGYRSIFIDGKSFLAHRVAWLLAHGAWPDGDIDHIDGNRQNNRIENLRDVSRRTNLQNRRAAGSHRKHGSLLGAAWHASTGKWRALIKHEGRQVSLGYFATEQEAHVAYVEAKRRLHEGCTI